MSFFTHGDDEDQPRNPENRGKSAKEEDEASHYGQESETPQKKATWPKKEDKEKETKPRVTENPVPFAKALTCCIGAVTSKS